MGDTYMISQYVADLQELRAVIRLETPASVSAKPELPGFVLDLTYMWENTF